MMMRTFRLPICFTTPAFLGNAEQNAQWRTPPIKALLRQWWRVAYAADKNFAVRIEEMWDEEGMLFGHAKLENDQSKEGKKVAARKSEIRIRLTMPDGQTGNAWSSGTQQGVAPLSTGLDTGYAWFGLVNRGSGKPDRNAIAIKSNENRRDLLLAVPDNHAGHIQTTLQLIHAFGQLGSRSRGGWGSFILEGIEPMKMNLLEHHARSLDDCLRHDWPMSLCKDGKGLCLWESKNTFQSWDKAMRTIALERKSARVVLKAFKGKDLRPVLGFATPGRMPSPLRWRVVPATNDQLTVRVFAMPTRIPEEGKQRISDDETKAAWQAVFQAIDSSTQFKPREQKQ